MIKVNPANRLDFTCLMKYWNVTQKTTTNPIYLWKFTPIQRDESCAKLRVEQIFGGCQVNQVYDYNGLGDVNQWQKVL